MDFIANLFECWGLVYLGDFSKFLYKSGTYTYMFLWLVGFIVLIPLFYYKIIDHIKLAKVWIWLLIGAISGFLCSLILTNMANNAISDYMFREDIQNVRIETADPIRFGVYVLVLYFVLFFIVSLFFAKTISIKSRKVPF